MKQVTFDQFNEETLEVESRTVSNFTCPHCRKVVMFIVPDGGHDMRSTRVELEHYKELARRLMKDNYDLKMFCRRLAQQ